MALANSTKKRPKYLDLTQIHLPLPGIVSILHRISGLALFLIGIPFLLWVLNCSLASQEGFESWRETFNLEKEPEIEMPALDLSGMSDAALMELAGAIRGQEARDGPIEGTLLIGVPGGAARRASRSTRSTRTSSAGRPT